MTDLPALLKALGLDPEDPLVQTSVQEVREFLEDRGDTEVDRDIFLYLYPLYVPEVVQGKREKQSSTQWNGPLYGED